MRSLFTVLLAALLSASCAPAAAVVLPAETSSAEFAPIPTSAPRSTPEPPTYARSLLLARWDPETSHHSLAPVEPVSGLTVPGYAAIDLGVNYYYAYSPDHSSLLLVTYPDDTTENPTLHLVNLASWHEVTWTLEVAGWVSALAFRPDGKQIAISTMYRQKDLQVFDLESGTVTAHIQPEFEISNLRYTLNGESLMAYGRVLVDRFTENERSQGHARVSLYRASDLSTDWSVELTGVRDGLYALDENDLTSIHAPGNSWYYYPGVVFAPRANTLYVIHAEKDALTTVDFSARSFAMQGFKTQLSWFERFLLIGAITVHAKGGSGTIREAVISPDGKVIYTAGMKNETHQNSNGDWEFASTALDLQGIRTGDAAIVLDEMLSGDGLRIAPDGDRLFIQGWTGDSSAATPQTMIFDLNEGIFKPPIRGVYATPARRMDGTLLLVSNESMSTGETLMGIYDFKNGAWIGDWTSPTLASWLTEP